MPVRKTATITTSAVTRLEDLGISQGQISDAGRVFITPTGGGLRIRSGTDPTSTNGLYYPPGRSHELRSGLHDIRMLADTEDSDISVVVETSEALTTTTDFVRTALRHPRFATSDYGFSVDQTFTSTDDTDPGRAKADGGGIELSTGESVVIQHTASASSSGYHTVKLGIDIPDGGELTVTVDVDSVEQVSYKVGGGDGGANPSTSTDFTVITPETQVQSGELLEVTLAYTGSDTLLIDFADYTITSEATAATGTILWSWVFGDISQATFDAYVDPANGSTDFTLESNSRLTSGSNNNRLDLAVSPHRLAFPISYEVADMESDGKLKFYSDDANNNAHCYNRIDNAGLSVISDRVYFDPNTRYRVECEYEYAAQGTADWNNLDWCIPFQMHPGGYPAGHNEQAPINLYVRGLSGPRHQFQLLGNTNNPPGAESWTDDNDFFFPFTTGFHRLVLEWETDPTGSGNYAKLEMDRITKVESTVPHGLKYSASDTTEARLYVQFGVYSSVNADNLSPGPEITFHSVKMYQVT